LETRQERKTHEHNIKNNSRTGKDQQT